MRGTNSGFRQKVMQLLEELAQGDSELALRGRKDPEFHRRIEEAKALVDFYGQMGENNDALRNFERELCKWIRSSPDAYVGLVGELRIADYLRLQGIPHSFIQETKASQTPDIELTMMGREICLEVKTMQENPYMRFAEKVLEGIKQLSPGREIMPEKVIVKEGKEEALVAIAVQAILDDLPLGPYAPSKYQYKGEEGEFSFVLSPELVLPPRTGIIWSWSGSRVRTNGTPWLESILEKILRDNIGQFKADKPTFLVWVTSDLSLAGLKTHVSRVLEQYGHIDFINVAGVIICDSFLWWDLTENPATRYREMKDSGLFDAIRGIKPHRQAG